MIIITGVTTILKFSEIFGQRMQHRKTQAAIIALLRKPFWIFCLSQKLF